MSAIGASSDNPDSLPYLVKVWDHNWTSEDCEENPSCLFVFGDNLQRKGRGGQAIIRGEPNTIGIPTKKKPSLAYDAFFYNEDYDHALVHIDMAIVNIETLMLSGKYTTLVIPHECWGSGLARLHTTAPRIYSYVKSYHDMLVHRSK